MTCSVQRAFLLLILGVQPLAAMGKLPANQSFTANGVKIHYVVEGQGEPVVLLHGLHASAKINWQLPGIFAALAKDYRVIALDLPGHGESDKPQSDGAYGLQMSEDVRRLLDHLKIKKAHLVGYSLGGMIAVKFMSMHQDRVLSGIVGGMGWLPEGSDLQKIWPRISERNGGRTPAACIQSFGKLAVPERALKAIRVPVEIIVGDRDPVKKLFVIPLETVREDWPVVEIEDAGHLTCVIKPQFKAEIKRWLDAHR